MSAHNRWGWGADEPPAAADHVGGAPGVGATILDEIIARTRADLVLSKQRVPEARLRAHAEGRAAVRDFAAALRAPPGRPPRIIAELKRASPSRGMIRRDFGVISLSRELEANGAAALSVLTETHYFRGSPRYLQSVAATVDIPVLRKDFIVDPYQIHEARAWGADAVLLIAAALDERTFRSLFRLASDIGLHVLAEVHRIDEVHRVLESGARIVGINSRNLRTFETSLDTTEALLAELPPDVVAVAESGIRDHADMIRLMKAGAHAFLIGETLMRAASPGMMLRQLLESAAAPTHHGEGATP